jgi:uncharacterized protein HemX
MTDPTAKPPTPTTPATTPTPPTPDEPAGSGRGPLIALLLVVIIAAGGFWLAQHLRAANRIQDCVMAGRTNCAPVQ